MSGDAKYPAKDVMPVAIAVMNDLRDHCAQIEIAGSLRRQKAQVGDIEIVALPYHAPTMLARLDRWVATQKAYKARYSDGSQRWGEKYRGIGIPGCPVKVEIFLADADNWGYQFWLRTGPGDANAYVMRRCIDLDAPYRAIEGYWRVEGRKLRVPDEHELFRLLGMSYLPPQARTLERYHSLLRGRWVKDFTYAEAEETTSQTSMF